MRTGPRTRPENGTEAHEKAPPHRFCGFRLTSSSLHAWSMSLLGCPGVMPEWPLDQSYETAYANIVPERLNVVHATGPGAGSNAAGETRTSARVLTAGAGTCRERKVYVHLRRVRASLSQKLIVPSDPLQLRQGERSREHLAKITERRAEAYRRWRRFHVQDGRKCR